MAHGTVNPSLQARVPARHPAICGLDSRCLLTRKRASFVLFSLAVRWTCRLCYTRQIPQSSTEWLGKLVSCLHSPITLTQGERAVHFIQVTAFQSNATKTCSVPAHILSCTAPGRFYVSPRSRIPHLGICLHSAWYHGGNPATLSTKRIETRQRSENEPRDQGNQPTIESRRLHNEQSCVSVQRVLVITCEPPRR